MLMMTGLAGGENCDPNTQWYQSDPNMAYYGSCIPFNATPSSGAPATTTTTTSSTPWWQSLVMGVAQGAVKGIVGGDEKPAAEAAPMPMPMPRPQPWYTTPTGMIGIGVGALALVLLLRK